MSDNATDFISNWYTNIDLFNQAEPFSDHFCVVIKFDFVLVLEPPIFKYCWRFNKHKDDLFCEYITANMQEWWHFYLCFRNDASKIHILTELFQSYIRDAAIRSYGIKMYNKNSKFNMSKKEKSLAMDRRKLEKKFKRLTRTFSRAHKNVKNIKKKINKINTQIRKERKKNLQEEVASWEERIHDASLDNNKEFYRLVQRATKEQQTKLGPLQDTNGNVIAKTKDEIAYELLHHFNGKLKENVYNDEAKANHAKVESFMQDYRLNRNQNNSNLNKPFTNHETLLLIKSFNLNSSMSYDMIHYKLIYNCRFEIVTYLTALYNLSFYEHRIVPNCWRFSPITPIEKAGRKPIFCKNIRPISVAPALLRGLEKMNANRLLVEIISGRIKLRVGNNAFQPNKSTDDILINITENVYKAFENGSFLELSFMDVKSAYDSVWIDGFIYKLINKYNIDGNFIAWNYNYLLERYNRVDYNGFSTDWQRSRCCFPQG